MSAGVTTWATPMSSNNCRRRGEADARRSTGRIFCSSFTMIGVIVQDQVRAIQLFGEHHANHRVRKRQCREGPRPVRPFEDPGAQSVRTADEKTEVPAILQSFA